MAHKNVGEAQGMKKFQRNYKTCGLHAPANSKKTPDSRIVG